ncbi:MULTISPECIES: LexA family transcriptional regulator [unclassified Pseudomonas]|uniref:LexA family protein n=1 Tax=unclassified Pseudomonas TaxID=196821 RepID=UPI000BC6138E|nr:MULTISPECIES: LexA family transcriptional regulator [unclassified Pseudomonas]PVZ20291.1 SOS-response transcriptional repressor LexA [Pseudomonas sp. URIL14HWK12:I12]PVZ27357.1 SOS-response transcriptional repressor LexA [Pseudomonas sp. URIL14HWK12:I10]PVZ38246.1 SOS-response transcriptional repressor LexA [Pseudomonas sp. URIL14HWK12:I11]SNZ04121.1 SOS-response transcriptional repressor LexA (RecA-mediated autopeptidase) [Pseudomonas sp. URIL14HWK12:I9]
MDEWIKMVKLGMREQRLTQERLADRVGASQAAVNHWLTGRREPGQAMMNRILRAVGHPEMEVATVLRVADERAGYDSAVQQAMALEDGVWRYPCLDWSAFNEPDFSQCTASSWFASDYHATGAACWVCVTTEAMLAPAGLCIPVGSWVLVDTGLAPKSGQLAVVRQASGGLPRLRQWVEEGEVTWLRPLNPTWPTQQAAADCTPCGVVVRSLGIWETP